MDTLGIDVDATDGDNLNTFKRMNNETGEFTYGEVRSRMVSDAEQERQMQRLGRMCGGIRATTRRRRRDESRVDVARSTKGILELHETCAPHGAGKVWD